MMSLAESEVLERIGVAGGTSEKKALCYVRRTFEDDQIQQRDLIGPPLDFIHAMDQEKCADKCPGVGVCPYGGLKWSLSMEDLNGRRIFLVRVGKCRAKAEAEVQAKTRLMVTASKIPEGMKRCTFKTFQTSGLDQSVRTAKGLAMACVEDGSSVVFGGNTGVGKTHLSIAMVQDLVERGKCAIFVSVVDLLDEIRAGFDSGKSEAIQKGAKEADCLVLDDLGAQRTTEWVAERLFAIIDDRYRNGRQTVITTNAGSMKDLESVLGDKGARITSRLSEMAQALFIKARDYRTRKNVQTKFPADL